MSFGVWCSTLLTSARGSCPSGMGVILLLALNANMGNLWIPFLILALLAMG